VRGGGDDGRHLRYHSKSRCGGSQKSQRSSSVMSRLRLKSQGLCVFCGRPGLSKEHVWPQWTHEFVPRETAGRNVRAAGKVSMENPKLVVTEMKRERQGSVNTLQVRVVCKQHCNNGWMSILEERVKPILTPLMLGQSVELGQREETILATWITKTVMMFEFAYPKNVSSSTEQRRHVMNNQEPPPGWHIWIAHYHGEQWKTAAVRKSAALGVVRGHLAVVDLNGSNAKNTQSVVFGIGELLVVALATSIPLMTFEIPPNFEPFTPQLWPLKQQPLCWSTGKILNDADATILTNGFSRMLRNDVDHFDPPLR
jgi:hypothetical protein